MCEPTTMAIATATMTAASSITAFMGQQSAAQAMNQQYTQNADGAVSAYSNDIEANSLNAIAAGENASQQRFQTSRDVRAAKAEARAGAADRGVGGLSVAALQRDLGFQGGQNISAIDRNEQLDASRNRLANRGARDTAVARIRSRQRSRGPSLAALGIDIGNAALSGYQMRGNMQADRARAAAASG